jgi:hypothetical protein
VSLFVPILATLILKRPTVPAAYASVVAGNAALFVVAWLTGGHGYGWAPPVSLALLVSAASFGLATVARPAR